MRIAFVGKGGSGKTTLAVLFAQYAAKANKRVVLVDADLNMHTPGLLGHDSSVPEASHISHPDSIKLIQSYLRNKNTRIKDLQEFRKTTPPTRQSRLVNISTDEFFLSNFVTKISDLSVIVVGTYQEDGIGTACYHNNLSIFENILTHSKEDPEEVIVVDMVAGIDSFANTLHAQFDLIVLVVEPTLKSLEVFNQFDRLAKESRTSAEIVVVGNKISDPSDRKFLTKSVPKQKLLGFFGASNLVRRVDQSGGKLDLNKLEPTNTKLLETIFTKLVQSRPDIKNRYHQLLELHKKYISQQSILDRFGDLTRQIDIDFDASILSNHEAK